MLQPFRKLVAFSSSTRGSKIVIALWLLAVVLFSALAPSAKEFAGNSKENSVKGDTPSEIAAQVLEEQFPSDKGLPALLVFHREEGITNLDREKIIHISEWLASEQKPEHLKSALPFHEFPKSLQDQMFSRDGTTLLVNVMLEPDLDSDLAFEAMENIRDKASSIGLDGMKFEITGPAGISADTISLFKNADFVLMLATVALIFIILIAIYRSPVLAITPLVIAGIVYGVVDRILGIAGKNGLFPVDSSAISIMLVLLFAVLTDYSLFVFSRYKEELKKQESKYGAMGEAMYHVSEPIVFSGGTILLAMLTLFVTVFQPYNHFAPVFSTAVAVILLAGLTLIPSMFSLLGRKAFWPSVPKVQMKTIKKEGIWSSIASAVMKRPGRLGGIFLAVFLAGALQFPSIQYSFNLLKSFPEDMPSRQGFELLEDHFEAGQLAPVTVIMDAGRTIDMDESFLQKVSDLRTELEKQNGVSAVTPQISEPLMKNRDMLPRNFLAESGEAIRLQLVLDDNPYELSAVDTIQRLRDSSGELLEKSNLSSQEFELHYAGQTAQQLDARLMNQRDTIVLFSLVTVLLTVILFFQTQSFLMPVLMMSTILLSYFSTMGFSWWIFRHVMDFEAVSYRLPIYTFVFMVALGIDYNIMLVSRIKEETASLPWKEAVGRGVALTGGVISSAGLILAATFAVLMTQPIQELFLFGFTMALGILLDTFVIRGVFFPAILILTNRKKKERRKTDSPLGM
ncbi:MAG TPA: MMPL family transporter [Bacillaceae bacterium]